MKYKLVFLILILILIYSCSSISKKNKSDYFVSKVNVNKDINGQLSILKCSKDPKNEYIIKFNKSKDSLIFNSSVNICDLLKEHLLDGGYIISDISFRVNSVEQKLKYN